jgi:hypothetical protein
VSKLIVGETRLKLTTEGVETLRAANRKIKHDADLRGVLDELTPNEDFIRVRLPGGQVKTYARRFWEPE